VGAMTEDPRRCRGSRPRRHHLGSGRGRDVGELRAGDQIRWAEVERVRGGIRMDHDHAANPGDRVQLRHQRGRNGGPASRVRHDETGARAEEALAHDATPRGAARRRRTVRDDRADHAEGHGRDEEGDDEAADRPKSGTRIVSESSPGDERSRPAGAASQHPGADQRQPRSGDDEPGHGDDESRSVRPDLAARGAGPPADEERELTDAGEQGDDPPGTRRCRRGAPGDSERRDAHSSQRDPRRPRGRYRDTKGDDEDVGDVKGKVAGEERLPAEGKRREGRPEHEEQNEAADHTARGSDQCFNRSDHRELSRRRADQAHGGEALLPTSRREPGRCGDEDEDGEQQRAGDDGQDELDPPGVRVAGATLRRGFETSHLARLRRPRQFRGGVTDDDEQRVG
jgi:hypothetical protein